jgi:hypothetical protein
MQGHNGQCALATNPSYLQSKHHNNLLPSSASDQMTIELTNQTSNRSAVNRSNSSKPMHPLAPSSENVASSYHTTRLPAAPIAHQPSALNHLPGTTNEMSSMVASGSMPLNTPNGPVINGNPTTTQLMSHSTSLPVAMDSCMLRNRAVFVQRDYSNGVGVRFETKFPPELEGRIGREKFDHLIAALNQMFEKAETISAQSLLYNCLSCMTAYLMLGCVTDQYGQMMMKVRRFINQQNALVFSPRGLTVGDPLERGLRVLEIQIEDPDHN